MSISFGDFELDRDRRQLLCSGRPIPLEPKAYELLCLLVERRPRALSRAQIRDAIWPGTFISESTLGVVVNGIRQALEDDARQPRFVRTVHGFGYAFCGEAREGHDGNEGGSVARHPGLAVSPVTEAAETGDEERVEPAEALAPEQVASLPAVPKAAPSTLPTLGGAAAVALVAAVALGSWFLSRRGASPPAAPPRIVPFTTDGGWKRHPKLSPDGEKVAYEWRGDIYVKAIGVGTRALRLTEHEAPDVCPVWSPDGRQIAFVRVLEEGGAITGGAIYTVPSLGGQERKLTDVERPILERSRYFLPGLSWSPDGRWLAFVQKTATGEPARIARLWLDTMEKQPLTSPPEGTLGDLEPELSPDGRLVAFVRSSAGESASGNQNVWVQPVEGGSARPLTSERYNQVGGLAWTAAGDEVLFTADATSGSFAAFRVGLGGGKPQPVVGVTQNAGHVSIRGDRMVYRQTTEAPLDIWRVPGRRSRRVDEAPERLIASSRSDMSPAYSPDGQRIAFESDRSGVGNIWVCDADGSNPLQLTTFDRHTGTPRWSPDGRRIAFDSSEAGDWNIYVIDAEGGASRRLTPSPSGDFRPTWSRDGRWIYFASDRSGSAQIWKLPSEGGTPVQVTSGGGTYAEVSADDRNLYFTNRDHRASIRRVSVDGGEETEVVPGPIGYVDWAISRDGIYYAQPTGLSGEEFLQWGLEGVQGVGYSIRFLDLASGQTRELFRKGGSFLHRGLAVSPGEEWILYSESPVGQSELMLMENFR